MESRRRRGCVVEMKVVSCKDLKAFNFFQKLSVYALVSLQQEEEGQLELVHKNDDKKVAAVEQNNCYQVQQVMNNRSIRTPSDGEGDGNPEWNHDMKFEFDDELNNKDWNGLFFHFDLRHDGVGVFGIGDRSIGDVRVPLKDLIILNSKSNKLTGQEAARFVNYQVTTSDGKPNGILNFSYKLIIKDTNGGDVDDRHQPRIQYPTLITLQADGEETIHSSSNNYTSGSAFQHQECSRSTSTAAAASSAMPVPPDKICYWHHHHYHNYDPPPPPPPPPPRPPPPRPLFAGSADHAYYKPPPPLPMANHGASYHPPNNYLLPPHPQLGRHPNYNDYGPWSPANTGPRQPKYGHRHG